MARLCLAMRFLLSCLFISPFHDTHDQGLPLNTEDSDHKVGSRSKNYTKVKVYGRFKCTRDIQLQFQQRNRQFTSLFMISKAGAINPLLYVTVPKGS
jgi:hypothetical protein